MYNDLTVRTGVDAFAMTVEGEGADTLPRDASNLVVRGLELAFRAGGWATVSRGGAAGRGVRGAGGRRQAR